MGYFTIPNDVSRHDTMQKFLFIVHFINLNLVIIYHWTSFIPKPVLLLNCTYCKSSLRKCMDVGWNSKSMYHILSCSVKVGAGMGLILQQILKLKLRSKTIGDHISIVRLNTFFRVLNFEDENTEYNIILIVLLYRIIVALHSRFICTHSMSLSRLCISKLSVILTVCIPRRLNLIILRKFLQLSISGDQ